MKEEPNSNTPDIDAAEAAPAPEAGPRRVDEARRQLQEQIVSLLEELKKLHEEKQGLANQLLRRQADFDNLRKRTEREKEEFRRKAEIELVAALLPVLDDFERALAVPSSDDPEYRRGVELIYKRLSEALARAGLEAIEPVGKPFDPLFHHAIESVESAEHADQEVIAELQRGYTFNQQLVRPAMVRVAVHPPSAAADKPAH